MSYSPFKMKGFPEQSGVSPNDHTASPAKLKTSPEYDAKMSGGTSPAQKKSPAKHSTNRDGHNDDYGKGHTNKDHPEYWKVKERTTETTDKNPDYDETKSRYINKDGEYSNYKHTDESNTENPDYDETKSDDRKNYKYKKYYASDKDREIQRTKHKKKGGGYMGDYVYSEDDDVGHTSTNTKDRVGKTDRNTYKTGSKSKSKTKTKSKKGKLPSYEASYTSAVADKWKDKGGKAAYIKAAKAWNAKNRK